MAQHDMVIDNASGASVRGDINNALQALATVSGAATEPATIYPYQLWADSTSGTLKQRNGANSAWNVIGRLDTAWWAGINNFRLLKSGANLTLEPVNGTLVDINDALYSYSVMPTLGLGGLSAATTYYIYLYDNAGTATLLASTTAPAIDSKGRAYMTGFPARRLMGVARTVTGPAWEDSLQRRLVMSYDNRLPSILQYTLPSDRSTASAVLVELDSTDRLDFVCFSNSGITCGIAATVDNASVGALISTYLYADGVAVAGVNVTEHTASAKLAPSVKAALVGTIPYRYLQLFGLTSAGTAYWRTGSSLHAYVY